jgi:hypothetical protein
MSKDSSNPYAPTAFAIETPAVDAALLAKVNAINKDAGQFWLAMLLCLLCSALGSLIIGMVFGIVILFAVFAYVAFLVLFVSIPSQE